MFNKKIAILCVAVLVSCFSVLEAKPVVDKIHFLIPGGAGGGWDGTARGTGEALTKSGLLGEATYENMSGGGGGRAIGYLIENANSLPTTLMVSSTPIIMRSLTRAFPYNFTDLTLVASIIGDYAALAVKKDSSIQNLGDFIAMYKKDPKSLPISGGSVAGGMDHLVPALIVKKAGADPKNIKYLPFDAGGKALAAVLSGEAMVLSSGLSEMIEMQKSGDVRIIAITSEKRLPALPDVPTAKEQKVNATFVNWRGFFGPPKLTRKQVSTYNKMLKSMYDTAEWEEVRKRNSWVNIYNPDREFFRFLKNQEMEIGELMLQLGFLR